MTTIRPSPRLTAALWLDVAGSAAVAVLQLAAAQRLESWLQLPQPLLFHSGVLMVGWAALLALLARRPSLPRAVVRAVILGNAAWALAALALAVELGPGLPGQGFLAFHALAVTVFAALQQSGLKRSPTLPKGLHGVRAC